MVFKEIITAIENATHPVAKILHTSGHVKTMAIGFKKGMILKEHQSPVPAKLFVLKGQVLYKEAKTAHALSLFEEKEIPIHILHSVEALEDSLCLLIQG